MNKYHKKIKRIITKLTPNAHSYENYGQKEYRKFRDKVNMDDNLSCAEKAHLCAELSEKINNLPT